MATTPDSSRYERFSDVTQRFDEIIASVRNKDTSLERSLDLLDEAIALGTRAVDLVDKAAFSPEERERLAEADEAAADASPGPDDDPDSSSNGAPALDAAPAEEPAAVDDSAAPDAHAAKA